MSDEQPDGSSDESSDDADNEDVELVDANGDVEDVDAEYEDDDEYDDDEYDEDEDEELEDDGDTGDPKMPHARRDRLATAAAVFVAFVLVVVLGSIALERVSTRWEARRDAAATESDGASATRGPGTTDDVALVGDSITEQSEGDFHRTLDATYRLRVRGRGGYRIEEMEPYAIALAIEKPEQVIINLGSNDVLKNWPIDKAVTALNRMIKDFDGARCIHLVTMNEGFYSDNDPNMGTRALVFNLELRRIATSHNIDLIDWSAAVKANDSKDAPMTSDTVHPTEKGRKILAGLYLKALDNCR